VPQWTRPGATSAETLGAARSPRLRRPRPARLDPDLSDPSRDVEVKLPVCSLGAPGGPWA
jgi:hypothetical protein